MRRDGQRAQTVALAGTTRRSADPAVDDHLGEQLLRSAKNREEQDIVTRSIERTLDPVSLWVAAAGEPALVKVHNVQHLATPIRAQLADPLPTVELAGMLLPTPAVGGEPPRRPLPLIPALEGLDRGWYAGAVGWTDLAEDGEFCVALRCALLRGKVAHLYAGCGIVRDSVPARGARGDRGEAPGPAAAAGLGLTATLAAKARIGAFRSRPVRQARYASCAATRLATARWSSTFVARSVRTTRSPGPARVSTARPVGVAMCSS